MLGHGGQIELMDENILKRARFGSMGDALLGHGFSSFDADQSWLCALGNGDEGNRFMAAFAKHPHRL